MQNFDLISLVFGLFVLTQAYDFYSTWQIVGKHGGLELNPLIKWLMDRVGIVPALAIKTVFTITLGAMLCYSEYLGALGCVVAVYLWVCWNNYKALKASI